MADMGGEFEPEGKEELEAMGSRSNPTAPYSPTQNAVCERHGQKWKDRAPVSESYISNRPAQLEWLTASINYAENSAVGPCGCSPSQ